MLVGTVTCDNHEGETTRVSCRFCDEYRRIEKELKDLLNRGPICTVPYEKMDKGTEEYTKMLEEENNRLNNLVKELKEEIDDLKKDIRFYEHEVDRLHDDIRGYLDMLEE